MMPTSEQSTLVAVFVNRDQANQAIDNLRHAGFSVRAVSPLAEALSFIHKLQTEMTS